MVCLYRPHDAVVERWKNCDVRWNDSEGWRGSTGLQFVNVSHLVLDIF